MSTRDGSIATWCIELNFIFLIYHQRYVFVELSSHVVLLIHFKNKLQNKRIKSTFKINKKYDNISFFRSMLVLNTWDSLTCEYFSATTTIESLFKLKAFNLYLIYALNYKLLEKRCLIFKNTIYSLQKVRLYELFGIIHFMRIEIIYYEFGFLLVYIRR